MVTISRFEGCANTYAHPRDPYVATINDASVRGGKDVWVVSRLSKARECEFCTCYSIVCYRGNVVGFLIDCQIF